jgi:hypothetical protein
MPSGNEPGYIYDVVILQNDGTEIQFHLRGDTSRTYRVPIADVYRGWTGGGGVPDPIANLNRNSAGWIGLTEDFVDDYNSSHSPVLPSGTPPVPPTNWSIKSPLSADGHPRHQFDVLTHSAQSWPLACALGRVAFALREPDAAAGAEPEAIRRASDHYEEGEIDAARRDLSALLGGDGPVATDLRRALGAEASGSALLAALESAVLGYTAGWDR